MVGSKGRGRASASKSRSKTLALVSADPKPLNMDVSADCHLDGEERNNEMPNRDENSMDEKESGDASFGGEDGDGHEAEQLPVDERNDEEKDTPNDLNDDGDDDLISGETKEDIEELNDERDATNKVDDENNEEMTNKENLEKSDGGGSPNNVGVNDIEEVTHEEVLEEDKAPLDECLSYKDINSGEEKKASEVDAEGNVATTEGITAVEHEKADDMANDLKAEGESNKLEAEEPLGTVADDKKIECAGVDAGIADDVKAAPENANKPKRKLVKKKLVKKKTVLKNDVASVDKTKPQSLTGNDVSSEVRQVEMNEHGKDEEKDEEMNEHGKNEEKGEAKQPVKVNRKLKRMRKKVVSQNHAGAAAPGEEQKFEPTNDEPVNEANKEFDQPEVKNEEAAKSGDQVRRLKKKKKKKVTKNGTSDVVIEDINKPGPSRKGKSSKKIDTMGMIFMCSSETKKDCYRYKVLGLPAGKKDFVLKIYKGMRLFLFDFDLRMMYGIYKAAGPGGYNIEPRAFKSQFPSQVRFTVLEECVPLAEEKFKKVIKDNYYTKNKFNCQLTSEQVRKLCKLFHETTKRAESKQIGRSQIAATLSSVARDRKRKRAGDGHKVGSTSSSKRERRQKRAEEDIRRGTVVIDDSYYRHPVYERETYLPPTVPATLYQPLPAQSPPHSSIYSYETGSRVGNYRRDSALEHRGVGLTSLLELRRPTAPEHRDPYVAYREPRTYHEPAYEDGVRLGHYDTGARRNHYEVEARREDYDYALDLRRVDYYRPAEYRAPLPPYRRY